MVGLGLRCAERRSVSVVTLPHLRGLHVKLPAELRVILDQPDDGSGREDPLRDKELSAVVLLAHHVLVLVVLLGVPLRDGDAAEGSGGVVLDDGRGVLHGAAGVLAGGGGGAHEDEGVVIEGGGGLVEPLLETFKGALRRVVLQ